MAHVAKDARSKVPLSMLLASVAIVSGGLIALVFGRKSVGYDIRVLFSMDGSKIVFDAVRDGRRVYAYTAKPDGTGIMRISGSATPEGRPAFSPDGNHVVYTSPIDKKGDIWQIYTMHVDGSSPRRLTQSNHMEDAPSYSRDGSLIVFGRANLNRPYSFGGMMWNDWDIYTARPDGTEQKRITHERYYQLESPYFSPDGNAIVYSAASLRDRMGGVDVYVLNVVSGSIERLTHGPKHPTNPYLTLANVDPSFSPDGHQIVFVSDRLVPYEFEVWVMNSDGTNPHQITSLHSRCAQPAFSTDGKFVVFMRDAHSDKHAGVWCVDLNGHDPRCIIPQSELYRR